ncbi:MAG: UDP-N-acetylmuramoyl-tripeptide--D-alanyl-D-alanine ligase [Deltaproteobacteria bacterium]|nr:UDP-N-acetylmuramoyl-tripeptide--D-alanyl-D-alanine ligase [Deltaproteobacteria bacterium]
MKLTVDDVCTATGGDLACGGRDTLFTSVTIDSRAVAPGALFVPLPGTRVDGHAYLAAAVRQGAAGFLFAQRAAPVLPDGAAGVAVRDPLTALQDLSAWYRSRLNARVIGIAGSNGKTTTKELLAQVCAVTKNTLATQGNQNNHIGLPLTLLRADENVEVMVLELGTSGPGELTTLCQIAQPHIGVITTIAEEHTETLKDLAGVIAAETELIAALPAEGVAVVNGDDEALLTAVRCLARCRIVTFGEAPANQFRVTDVQVSRQGTRFLLHAPAGVRPVQLRLLGSHFALAALAAVAAAAECGVALEDACAALRAARGAPRRLAVIEVPERHLTVLDDCYNANPASMRQALLTAQQVRAAGERLILVLGDMLELGALSHRRHCEIAEVVAAIDPRPDLLVTVGEEARLIATGIEQTGLPVLAFAAASAAAAFVREAVLSYAGPQLVLVKGSRGVHLEEVTRRVTEM